MRMDEEIRGNRNLSTCNWECIHAWTVRNIIHIRDRTAMALIAIYIGATTECANTRDTVYQQRCIRHNDVYAVITVFARSP